jgi:predicted alpha/beta hydrolase family esterase
MRHYIYIPGLGDQFTPLRCIALWRWKSRDERVVLVPMKWTDKAETYEQKYARVAREIERLKSKEIILVGESAGGAMALLAFSRHVGDVNSVVTICGYNTGAAGINPGRRHNPALYPLLAKVDGIIPRLSPTLRQRIITIYSTKDNVVTPRHSRIEGARKLVLHTPGHMRNITHLLIRGPKIWRGL